MADDSIFPGGKIPLTTGGFLSGYEIPITPINASVTLQNKLEPLFSIQSDLSKYISAFDKGILGETRMSIGTISNLVSPILESARTLSDNLAHVSQLTINAGLLSSKPSYDFLNSPLSATLNTTIDAIKIGQDKLSSTIVHMRDYMSSPSFSVGNQITNIGNLNNMSLGTLQSSLTLFPVESEKQRIGELDDKVAILEIKIKELTLEKDSLNLTNITEKVFDELEKIDSDLAKCFMGAMRILLANESEDLVAQVAESLTRVIENLPFKLANQDTTFSDKKSFSMIIHALGSYLGLIDENERNNHPLILQQQNFYTTLSGIRHRNKNIYPMFNDDPKRFRALVILVEAYIYLLLTFRNKI